jgi:N-acetylglucosaminyldiphosphoundecaprenol N-acetyl-beta-D-mannosaminyltransferase
MLSEPRRDGPLFGLPFTPVTLARARDQLLEALAEGRRQLVFTANTDHVVRVERHPELVETYLVADLLLADGMPVVWGSRIVGAPLPERVTGVDLMDELCRALGSGRRGIYLLGSTEPIASAAGRTATARYPGLRVVGTHHGFFGPEQDGDVVAAVNGSGTDALFVGMGSPRQERWVAMHADRLAPRLVVCVGGTLEVLAGVRGRAPRWMRPAGLEWTYRLFQEPARLWKRYLVDDAAFLTILRQEWRSRREHERPAA